MPFKSLIGDNGYAHAMINRPEVTDLARTLEDGSSLVAITSATDGGE